MAFVRGSRAVLVALFCFVTPSTAQSSIQAAVSLGTYPGYNAGHTTLSRHPGYTTLNGALNVTGTVSVAADGDGLTVTFSLAGLAANLTGGLHIHAGTSCNDDASVGSHYYTNLAVDPWNTTYTSDAGGTATGSFSVFTGYPLILNAQHAVLVHGVSASDTSTRVACGTVAYTPTVRGQIVVNTTELTSPAALGLFGSMTGLQKYQGAQHSVSGGIHIHTGKSCATAGEVGGHFYPNLAADPWDTSTYTVSSNGAVLSAQGSVLGNGTEAGRSMLRAGLSGWNDTMASVVGRALVVHDSFGNRIACGLITAASVSDASDDAYLTLYIVLGVFGGILLFILAAWAALNMGGKHAATDTITVKTDDHGHEHLASPPAGDNKTLDDKTVQI